MSSLQPGSNYAREIWQKDKDHHLHPWQLFDSFGDDGALIMDRAEGAWLVDIEAIVTSMQSAGSGVQISASGARK